MQPYDPEAFARVRRNWPVPEIDVDIRYSPATADGEPGEWTIVPVPERPELVLRFGVPPLLESWLIAEDEAVIERAAKAKRVLFSVITIFGDDNRTLQLRYRKVARHESKADEILSDREPELRRRLADRSLKFRRQERDESNLLAPAGELPAFPGIATLDNFVEQGAVTRPDWTQPGLTELLSRLDGEHLIQAKVIREAALQPDGRVARLRVYELGEYEEGRTVRGFTRPVGRITRQLERSGLITPGVVPALQPICGQDGQVDTFSVSPGIRKLLAGVKGNPHPNGSGSKKNVIKGPDDFLTRIPGSDYQQALRHIFSALRELSGLRVFWGTTGCSLRVALPGGPLSVGWIFPPEIPRWMGLTDLTLGWDEDSKGINISAEGRAALEEYFEDLGSLGGEIRPDSGTIRGWTFRPIATTAHAPELAEAVKTVVFKLLTS